MSGSQPLRLKWSLTWHDRPRDFRCRTPDGDPVGRLYHTAQAGDVPAAWRWFLTGRHRDRQATATGSETEKGSAARALEAAWFDAVARIDRL